MSEIGVSLVRGTKEEIASTSIVDGQLLFTTDQVNNNVYADVGDKRVIIGGGGSEPDNTLSLTSTNTVQNKVVTTALNEQNKKINATNENLDSLNDTLANCITYNPNDDYLYIDNVKWMLAELKTEFLYNNGETDKQFTLATESNGYVTHGETLSKTSNTLIFSSSMVSGSHFASGFLSTNVDLSRFSKLKCTITASGTISAFFGVANKKLININDSPSNILASQCITNNDNSFDLSIDITSINGQCEVGFWFGSDNTPGSRTITIEKVWLEI